MRKTILVALLAMFSCTTALAQFKASLQGTVTDPQGGAIAGAKITVTSQDTGVTRDTVTSAEGFYRISGLSPGKYTVAAEATGFKRQEVREVEVAAEEARGLDLVLAVGTVRQTVTVTAENGPELQTESGSVSGVLTNQQIRNLPVFGRDPFELLRLTPGVFGDASRNAAGNAANLPSQVGPGGSNSSIFQIENQVQIVANGQRVSANSYQVDGVSVNSLGQGGASVITPNQESVKEIRVISNSYSAEDGRNSGAHVQVVSQNGTNSFHGTSFIKFNDPGLNAFNKYRGPFGAPERVNQKLRQFGGSLGGPILKGKVFFFFSYEGLRNNRVDLRRNVLIEPPEFRSYIKQLNPNSIAAKIFSTAGIEPRVQTILNSTDCCSLVPSQPVGTFYGATCTIVNCVASAAGNGPDGVPDFARANLLVPSSSSGNQYNGRVDYNRGVDQFFGSFYLTKRDDVGGDNRPIEDIELTPTNFAVTAGWTRTLAPTMINEARSNFTRFSFNQLANLGTTNFGIPHIRVFDFDIGMGDGYRIGADRGGTTPGKFTQNTFEFRDTLSKVWRTHAFKFGFSVIRDQDNDNLQGGARPDYQFQHFLNFADDACCFFEAIDVDPRTGALPDGQRYFRTTSWGVFAQDDWKVRPNLTVNLGLRWEYFTPITETRDRISNYFLGSTGIPDGRVALTKSLYEPDRNNFGPRIGFAWSPGAFHSKMVVRGGFGVQFNRFFGSVITNIRQNTPFFASAGLCCAFPPDDTVNFPYLYALGSSSSPFSYPTNPGLAFGIDPVSGGLCANQACKSDTPVDIFGAPSHLPNAYVYVHSLEVQYQAFRDWIFSLGYQGSVSHRLIRTIDLNRFSPGDTFDNNQDQFQNVGSNGQPCGSGNSTCPAPRATGNKNFSRIFFPLADGNASYNALIARAEHRFSRGFTINALYTYSKSLDTASYEIGAQQLDPSNQALNRGPSDYDVTHNFTLTGYWELPIFRNRHDFIGRAAGGWTISGIFTAHSGFPWSPVLFGPQKNDPNGDSFRPDRPNLYNGTCNNSPSQADFINGVCPTTNSRPPDAPDPNFGTLQDCRNVNSCFTTPVRGVPGLGRNTFRGPRYRSVDFTFGKEFGLPRIPALGEGARLAFRATMYNAFNILNLQNFPQPSCNTDIGNTFCFGRSPGGLAGRETEFQLRFSF